MKLQERFENIQAWIRQAVVDGTPIDPLRMARIAPPDMQDITPRGIVGQLQFIQRAWRVGLTDMRLEAGQKLADFCDLWDGVGIQPPQQDGFYWWRSSHDGYWFPVMVRKGRCLSLGFSEQKTLVSQAGQWWPTPIQAPSIPFLHEEKAREERRPESSTPPVDDTEPVGPEPKADKSLQPRHVVVCRVNLDDELLDWPPEPLNDFVRWFHDKSLRIPPDSIDSTVVTLGARIGEDEDVPFIEIAYKRLETWDERAERLSALRAEQQAQEVQERALYEKLKRKFESP